MSILDKLLSPWRKATTNYPSWALAMAEQERWNIPSLTLPQRQAELYQRLSWVAIAVGHVAEAAAGAMLSVYRELDEDREDEINHPFEQLLKRPNPLQSRFEFLDATFKWRLLTGNAYWWLNRPNANVAPSEIWIIPADRIEPVPDGNMYLRGYLYDPGNGSKIPLEPWEIVQFKRFNPFSAYLGMSPVEALATVAIGDMKMQEWNTNFFGRDHAKLPGILAFSDPIPDPEWQRLQADIKEQHGGTKRNLMMLRNAGAGGVNWVATAMSQRDMEFLQAREFNKQEIYDVFAPGLASWLSISSTEANSITGRDAFMELAIWPLHQAIAETITNAILPAYGENLVCEFDDVRPKDRAVVLQEQAAYAQVHTIDEIRARYYSADPIQDERGALLPSQIAQLGATGGGFPGTTEPAENAAKAETDAFARFAEKRIAEGRPDKIERFVFEHVSHTEQIDLKAKYLGSQYLYAPLVAKLSEAIAAMREAT